MRLLLELQEKGAGVLLIGVAVAGGFELSFAAVVAVVVLAGLG
jgi:hypothetical protein